MGKKIGIKLADGTFYPIMDDGIPQKKLMELTTVQDNQTTASVDLYRSESGTMEDAEYVDTLELSELVPHPGGEASIRFTIQIDEDNELSAEAVDLESGKTSTTRADLVNLPSSQRHDVPDFTLSEIIPDDFEEPPLPEAPTNGAEEEVEESEVSTDEFDDVTTEKISENAGDSNFDLPDFNLDDFAAVDSLPGGTAETSETDIFAGTDYSQFGDDSLEETAVVSEVPATIDDLPDFGDVSFDTAATEETGLTADGSAANFDLPDFDLDSFASVDETSAADETFVADEEAVQETFVKEGSGDDSHVNALLGEEDSFGAIPDFSFPNTNESFLNAKESFSEDAFTDSEDSFAKESFTGTESSFIEEESREGTSFDLPDFSFGEDTISATSGFADSEQRVYEDSLPDFSKFELPDFDDPVRNDFSFEEESGLFTENDFKDPAFYSTETSYSSSASSPLDFSGLYEDTENELMQQETRKRRSAISVVICVICALVCVGILLFILFLLPSKISEQATTADSQLVAVDSHTVTVTEAEAATEPDKTAAVEDVIVIVETPSVVPAPPVQAEKTPEAVRYTVKWGDTLWDIAQSYYNNPWLYKRIAVANNIPNADYIVAGTVLTIPPQ